MGVRIDGEGCGLRGRFRGEPDNGPEFVSPRRCYKRIAVLGKALGVLGHAECFELVRNLLHLRPRTNAKAEVGPDYFRSPRSDSQQPAHRCWQLETVRHWTTHRQRHLHSEKSSPL